MKVLCMAAAMGVGIGLSILSANMCLADEPITVSGCAVRGIESGCIYLKTATGAGYNISAAKPTPRPGSYGKIKGTLKSNGVSTCMQGQVISPAAWTETAQNCPSAK
jgi:hypothetical protein